MSFDESENMFLGRSHLRSLIRIAVSRISSDLAGFAGRKYPPAISSGSTVRSGRVGMLPEGRRKSATQLLVSQSYWAKAGPSGQDVAFGQNFLRHVPQPGDAFGKRLLTVRINPLHRRTRLWSGGELTR
jgi:hypothetical protein